MAWLKQSNDKNYPIVMPVTKELQGYGTWRLTLSEVTQSRLRAINMWSTVYVIPTLIPDVEDYTQSDVERMAVYAGVLLDKNSTNNGNTLVLSGHDIGWWLGEPFREGYLCPEDREFSMADPADVITEIWAEDIPIRLGTLTNPQPTVPNPSFTGTVPAGATVLEVLNRVASETYTTWKVNVDGTVDFGPAEDLFNTQFPYTLSSHDTVLASRRGLKPDSLQTYTNGRALNGARVETPEGLCEGAIADLWHGYKDFEYTRATNIQIPEGDESEARALLQRLLNNQGRLQVGATALFAAHPFLYTLIRPGDTVLVHDDALDWASTDHTVDVGAIVRAQGLVCTNVNWAITEDLTVCLARPNTTEIINITDWINVEPLGITLTMGDKANSFLHGILGSADVVTPVEDIFEGYDVS